MAEVDNFCAGVLQDPAHDVNGRIMAVKKGGGSDHPDGMFGLVSFNFCAHVVSLVLCAVRMQKADLGPQATILKQPFSGFACCL
jgi:hypothetical protein